MARVPVKSSVRKKMGRRDALRLAGAATVAAVGSQWGGMVRAASAPPGPLYLLSFRALLVVAVNQKKASSKSESDLRTLIISLARRIREVPGVIATQPFLYRDFIDESKEFLSMPWHPNGVVVYVEANDDKTLEGSITRVYAAVKAVDQTMMRLTPIDGWRIR